MKKIDKRSEGYKTRAERKKEKKEIKRISKMEKKFLIGWYDDYRKEGNLNCILNAGNSKLIGTYSTEPIYTMYDVDNDTVSCSVETNGNNSIKVEVWEINETTLDKIERNYNYYADFEEYPQDYKKEEILSPFGKIEMYFTNIKQSKENIIINGDWIEYLNYKRIMDNKKENVL